MRTKTTILCFHIHQDMDGSEEKQNVSIARYHSVLKYTVYSLYQIFT